ncbi:hypothetical protein ACVIJ6_007251 [Bradyrhizobium sp. USDA 4369]
MIERDEALRMLGGDEDVGCVVDPDRVVDRRVHHQQRLVQMLDLVEQALLGDVVEERAADAERTAGERHFRRAVAADRVETVLEHRGDMGWI